MLIVQSPSNPTQMRNALADLASLGVLELHVACAYVSWSGSKILLDQVEGVIGENSFKAIPKRLVTSLDYGLTEPSALRKWSGLPNSEVFVAGAESLAAGTLAPKYAFHPKMYVLGREGGQAGLLVGSANLTARGLSVNSEAGWRQDSIRLLDALQAFAQIAAGTSAVTDALIKQYEELRKKRPPPPILKGEIEPVPSPPAVNTSSLLEFQAAVESGALDPGAHEIMWVHAEKMQGGSGNQLELPRHANRFFGFGFDAYTKQDKVTIGVPILKSMGSAWNDRLLTWHGNNRMERINLPTEAKGGFSYVHQAVMFRRMPDGSFELVVTPWESDLARAWRKASELKGLLYRLGKSGRLVGFL